MIYMTLDTNELYRRVVDYQNYTLIVDLLTASRSMLEELVMY